MKYIINGDTLKGLADALRSVTGETRSYTPTEMIEAVTTIMETGTYILVDESGNELPAVFLENERVFTATANDIREGTTAVTESGVTEGTKEIPSYHTYDGYRAVSNGMDFTIPHARYDYTKFQGIICKFNTSPYDSVAAQKIAVENNVYNIGSSTSLSIITKDDVNRRIVLGITNDTGEMCILRYIMYKEEY